MIVVKLGGSLFGHRNLGPGLNGWLASLESPVLLVPGGGAIADAVLAFDRIHRIGEEAAHWAALRSLTVTADLIATFIKCQNVHILDLLAFCLEHDDLPHSWDVTSDSLAAHVAMVEQAEKLILLKSDDCPDGTWESLAERGFVDRHFPIIVQRAAFPIVVLNFRCWLDRWTAS